MSSPSQTAAPSSIFESMLDTALADYKKKTGKDILTDQIANELKTCESVDGVLKILQDQAKAFEGSGDQKLMEWIDPLVHVLYTFSGALGDGVSLALPPAKVIFTGIGVLLAAAKDARASHAAVIDLFKRIESFFKRLGVYKQTSLTTEMAEVLVKIVIELLSILSIATKEMKRRRAKIFARKLLGRTDIEDALKRLRDLIEEEFQMVEAQILKIVTEAKDNASKANTVMQQDMEEVKRDILKVKRDVEEVKWTQIEQAIHEWLSPPDPSTNYNIARKFHYGGTAAWFFQSKKFQYWSSTGSLLWIRGKPGSGKSVLCSAVIKHAMSLCDDGRAFLAFFYFDFLDKEKKQDLRNFVASLLVQLSAYSTPCCGIISLLHSTHGKGTRQPSDDALTDCLRKMLSAAAQQSIYIIVDALDECPNASGIPNPREAVLDLLKDLVRLGLPELHICITSRPEFDIKSVLEPLPHGAVSLDDEDGQKKDISNYVTGVVDADRNMQSWPDEYKMLVVKELSNRAHGMFRWVFCQLEVLRDCFPVNIQQTLRDLPESLDETYARVLRDIKKTNRGHAHRMLQCLMVAVRPLFVTELAELLAFEFDGAQGGIPKYRPALRLDDQTRAVLSTCSSLITIVDNRWSSRQVVQFSHFSVKEFLLSDRLTSPPGNLSRYRILPGPAHTILTQACLGFLLHLDEHIDKEIAKGFPLAEYAAQHWVEHARFEDVALRVKDGMEALFDSDKPHFSAWIGIYDMDNKSFGRYPNGSPNPLYYSVLCGLYDLVKHLAIKYPHYVNRICGQYRFPLLAALGEDHVKVAELLLGHGANVNLRDTTGKTMLLEAFSQPRHSLVRKLEFLLEHGADVNARDYTRMTSLHLADIGDLKVAQILVKHRADVNSQNNNGETPLHILLKYYYEGGGVLNHARLLLECGAEANRRDKSNQTPLLLAMGRDWFKVARILLENGADASVENDDGKTPLHLLSESRIHDEGEARDLIRLLLEHGATMNRRDKTNQTPLHLAMGRNRFKVTRILLEHGADASVENDDGKTPLHLLSESRIYDEGEARDLIRLLLEHGATVNRRDKTNQTPLHLAMGRNWFKVTRILLEHGVDASVENDDGKTPLHLLSESRIYDEGEARDLIRLLLEHGATVNRRDKTNQTPLHLAMGGIWFKVARILLEHGADASVENDDGKTPLHLLSKSRIHDEGEARDLIRLLLEHGATVNRRDKSYQTLLLRAMGRNWFKVTRILLEHGVDASIDNNNGKTPLGLLLESQIHNEGDVLNHARLLLEHGAEANRPDKNNRTPLLLALRRDWLTVAQILIEHGADAVAKDGADKTNMVMQQDMEEVKRDVEEVKWTQIAPDIHKWFSPPDPSTNYTIACETYLEGTAAWFFQSKIFQDWTSNGSLLWIHGKPGSGKSILCSAIIKHVKLLRDAGQASLAYFYFDLPDKDKKQDFRNFVTSLLVQLSAYSSLCCKIISSIYSTHEKGTRQPSNDALKDCLVDMLSVAARQPIYIIVDALDECPYTSWMPSPRMVVLDLLENLVRLGLPNLHICVTSQPKLDIKHVLESLGSAVSLHGEVGHRIDISDYVRNVVSSDRMMKKWRSDQKEFVVEELSKKADGMSRWIFCQLEVLRRCLPASIRQTLNQLPESLDETYSRVLSQIPKANQAHAHRMLQCLVVAVRPLRVEELAELLAFEFDAAHHDGGIPEYHEAWRYEDPTEAVLSICSSLITIVDSPWDDSQVVQFSHLSVKEFLMSDRLTSPLGDLSRYHISSGPAHTLLTQACLGSLLHLDHYRIDKDMEKGLPLAEYAARHWVEHAQFEDVALRVKGGMEALFDSNKPHFSAWIGMYDMDNKSFGRYPRGSPNPLYYSVLCGFYDLVKHLAIKHPLHVNTICGQYGFPLLAALNEGHVKVAELLLGHGANVNVRDTTGKTMLLRAFSQPRRSLVRKVKFLLKHGADVNARDDTLMTSLHLAEYIGEFEVAQILVEHNADVNSQNSNGKALLHVLLMERRAYNEDSILKFARLLLKHGADANRPDRNNRTPLLLALGRYLFKVARILLEHGADASVENDDGKTPLHLLSESRIHDEGEARDLIRLLLEQGATVNRRDKSNQTPLHLAMRGIWFKVARILLERGADASVENDDGKTPLHLLSESRIHDDGEARDLIRLLLERGAAANRRDRRNQTLLLRAMGRNWFKVARILLEHGADASVENNNGKTPLHLQSESQFRVEGDVLIHARLLLEHGAEADKSNRTPLLLAMGRDWSELVQILIEHGTDAEAKDGVEKTNMVVQQDMEEIKWTQMEQEINEWFSPPDPSTNYYIACDVHHEGTATWFLKGTVFEDWLSHGSLLWIHGKPGSGKSILCSMIIKHVISLRDAGLASLAYFYFDFQDKDKKQDFRNFVASLLIQLSTYSDLCCRVISRFYSTHGKGMQQPSNAALKDCLREMLSVAARQPTYIIIDALDQYPNVSGTPTPREVVFDFLGGLVDLDLPNLHICVTSRPETDVKRVIESLPHRAVSLHDESGQRKDIFDYVRIVVYSDKKIQRWRDYEKELVIGTLSEKADGMFRWVACQLEVLRRCPPASIRQTLDQLPKSLDETYLRVLSQIPQANQAHAHRMLQCLTVAVRPLRVEELAELLAFEFDAAQEGIPKYHADWRYEDPTEAVLSICSSLVTIVDSPWDDSQVVQFSHLAVKEFLTSYRLASALGDISRYHISPGPAHTLLTQACIGSLLHLDHRIDKKTEKDFPLAEYAARHWVEHARFEDVALRVKDGIEALFDSDKPHFSAWIGIYDIDNKSFWSYPRGSPNPLYYSVLCGFYDLVKHLAIKYPHYVNRICGRYRLPLLAALGEGHVEIAELLLEHGANVNVRETGVEVGQ